MESAKSLPSSRFSLVGGGAAPLGRRPARVPPAFMPVLAALELPTSSPSEATGHSGANTWLLRRNGPPNYSREQGNTMPV
jgi:hypothetical protein